MITLVTNIRCRRGPTGAICTHWRSRGQVINGISIDNLLDKLAKGNLDPKELVKAIDMNKTDYPKGIPACGSDALRFGILAFCGQAPDVSY